MAQLFDLSPTGSEKSLVAIFDYGFGELLERKDWLPISVVLTIVGGLIIALAGSSQFWMMKEGSEPEGPPLGGRASRRSAEPVGNRHWLCSRAAPVS